MIRLKLNFSLVSFFVTKNKMEKSMDDRVSLHQYMYPVLSRSIIGNFPLVLPIHKRFSFNINNFLMGFNVKYLCNLIPFYKCQPCFILDFLLLFFFFGYFLCHCIKNFNKSKRIMQIKYLYERKYLEKYSQIGMISNADLTERC